MARTILGHSDEMVEIQNKLSYGDSKSKWIRHSIRMHQHVDLILNEVYESYQREERLDMIKKAVRKKVDKLKRENGKNRRVSSR